MAILESEVRLAASTSDVGLQRHIFSRDEYATMADAGLFKDLRIELIEGEIFEMAPIGDAHASLTHPLAVLLESAFGPGYSARNQAPISLGGDQTPSEPQPDVVVVVGTWRDYKKRKPTSKDIKLVVEIADSSLKGDRIAKVTLYGGAGIPEYWIVNLVDNQVEVYRDPTVDGFKTSTVYKAGDQVSPLHAPGATVDVADFLL